MTVSPAHFTSGSDSWETPRALFESIDAELGPFDLDVCALPSNAKCSRYFTPEVDGLVQVWTGRCWMNPPYGRVIGAWMRKAYEASRGGALVVCLVPSRTDTSWWHDYVLRGEVRFLRGRLKFNDRPRKRAPFPSAVVIFRPSGAE